VEAVHVLRWPGRQGANRLHGTSNNRHQEGSMIEIPEGYTPGPMGEAALMVAETVHDMRVRLAELEAENARMREALESALELRGYVAESVTGPRTPATESAAAEADAIEASIRAALGEG
jgi:hypothetical protein